jgi:hypothetical protein
MTRIIRVFIVSVVYITSSLSVINSAPYDLIYDLGTSARQIAIGNVDGFSDAADTVFENPAGLYRVKQMSLAAFSSNVMNEVKYVNVALSGGDTKIGRIGVGFMQASVTGIPETVRNTESSTAHPGVKTFFDYKSTVYKVAYQTAINKNIEFGINYVYYQNSLYSYSGRGSNIDLGVIYAHPKYETSILIRNAIPNQKVTYNTGAYEPLPIQYSVSMKRSFKNGWDVYPQIKYFHSEWLMSMGARYTPHFLPYIHFMSGYKSFLDATQKRHNNVTFGIGLDIMGLSIFYTYERSDYVLKDHKNYLSMTTYF